MATLDELRATAVRLEDEFLDELCNFPFNEELTSEKAVLVKEADEAVRQAEIREAGKKR